MVFSEFNMAEHNILGIKGEEAAATFLESKGHNIVERNWSFHGYEIDIISEDDQYIVFVEVKTRSSSEWGNPEEAVGKQRMRRLIAAAGLYIKLNQIDRPARFDIIAIIRNKGRFELEHFEDAFMAFL